MAEQKKKTCFVVMGFGLKTDYATGRTLDLDKTYHQIIKKAVEDAGLECIRADDIIHAGVIDKPMYELLLGADVVVADLSTSNVNAVYELGVRHALKPNTTIIIAEKQFKFPFDIGHIAIRMYEHLGNGIEEGEAERMRKNLKEAIMYLVDKPDTDSPVYTFLPYLNTPVMGERGGSLPLPQSYTQPVTQQVTTVEMVTTAKPEFAIPAPALPEAVSADDDSKAVLKELFLDARKNKDWDLALNLLFELVDKKPGEIFINSKLLEMADDARKSKNWLLRISLLEKLKARKKGDAYIVQQLALATYKSESPNNADALLKAKEILMELNPYQTTDPETLGLWGAIHKRLWEEKNDKSFLDESIWAYEKGFILKNDHYNGINYAYLMNVRAAISDVRDASADIVLAERIRIKVIDICNALLDNKVNPKVPAALIENDTDRFWVQASLSEAYFGTGNKEKFDELRAIINTKPHESWMIETMETQQAKLKTLLGV